MLVQCNYTKRKQNHSSGSKAKVGNSGVDLKHLGFRVGPLLETSAASSRTVVDLSQLFVRLVVQFSGNLPIPSTARLHSHGCYV